MVIWNIYKVIPLKYNSNALLLPYDLIKLAFTLWFLKLAQL